MHHAQCLTYVENYFLRVFQQPARRRSRYTILSRTQRWQVQRSVVCRPNAKRSLLLSLAGWLICRDKKAPSAQVKWQLQLTSGNTSCEVKALKLNGFAHRKLVNTSSQNRCVLPPDGIRYGFACLLQVSIHLSNDGSLAPVC